MSTTQHTGHYNLPMFGDNPNDRPSWRGDFTDAMTKIDNQMYANATNITTATAAANNATAAAGEAKTAAETAASLSQANKNDIADLDGYFGKLGVTSESTAQQLMDTINGKAEETELTSLESTVSSLSSTVNTKANASDVYTKGQADTTFTKQGGYSGTAQQLSQRIQALEDTPEDELPICLCIGDSYANSSNTANPDSTDATKWPAQLRNIIGGEYQVKSYAVTGAGFNVSGKTFTDQINNAYSAPAIDNDNVAIIIIGGGRNDIGTTPEMKGYANSTFSNARTKFPKARIISVPMLWHNAGMDMYGRQKAAGVAEAAAENGVETWTGRGRGTSATIPTSPEEISTPMRTAPRSSRPIWRPPSAAPTPDAMRRPPSSRPMVTCAVMSWPRAVRLWRRSGVMTRPPTPTWRLALTSRAGLGRPTAHRPTSSEHGARA